MGKNYQAPHYEFSLCSCYLMPLRSKYSIYQPYGIKFRVKFYVTHKRVDNGHKESGNSIFPLWSRDSSVGIATGYGLDDGWVGVLVPVGPKIFSSPLVQTGSQAHPASYPMGTGGSFPGGKAVGAWNWPLASNSCWVQENVDLYIHVPIRPHGVVLN
jgi:hypothetical protein